METDDQEKDLAVNPLTLRDISVIRTWKQWLETWPAAKSAEILHSLLHFGFSTEVENREEHYARICFYLDIADGHGQESNFGDGERRQEGPLDADTLRILSGRQLKKVLSKKAFNVLCNKVFKNRADQHEQYPSWAETVANPVVFAKLLWFFRSDIAYTALRVFNLDSLDYSQENDHNCKLARSFAVDMCDFTYTFRFFGRYADKSDEAIQEMFTNARPEVTRLLLALGMENTLLKRDYGAGEVEAKELEKISLAEELWDGTMHRVCTSLEEAYYLGSRAAKIAILLQIRERQREHFERIDELRRTKENAERELRVLQQTT